MTSTCRWSGRSGCLRCTSPSSFAGPSKSRSSEASCTIGSSSTSRTACSDTWCPCQTQSNRFALERSLGPSQAPRSGCFFKKKKKVSSLPKATHEITQAHQPQQPVFVTVKLAIAKQNLKIPDVMHSFVLGRRRTVNFVRRKRRKAYLLAEKV